MITDRFVSHRVGSLILGTGTIAYVATIQWSLRSTTAQMIRLPHPPESCDIQPRINLTEASRHKLTLEEVLKIQTLIESDECQRKLARHFNLSESAFRTSLSRIYHKLHIQRREQLISRLHALDLVEYVHPIATKEY